MSPPNESTPIIREILNGEGLSLAEAARLVPCFRPGRATHTATIWRWAARGVRLAEGSVVRLETCRIGGRQMTTRGALERFIRAQTPSDESQPDLHPGRPSPARRVRQATRASDALDRLGF
jgi:hypothetical protein